MGKSIKGTKTEQNLLKSFAGESQARNRYVFFASVAKKEGFEQIAGVFAETAEQEKEHAKRFFKFLEGGMVEITASYPAGIIGTTKENLAFLASNKGIALSREKILQKVWNYDYFGEDRTVDTHVKMLRGHLGKCRSYIATVWGIGYKFDPDAAR